MKALALEDVGVERGGRADVGVAVADTPPTHTDLLDGVIVPAQCKLKLWGVFLFGSNSYFQYNYDCELLVIVLIRSKFSYIRLHGVKKQQSGKSNWKPIMDCSRTSEKIIITSGWYSGPPAPPTWDGPT